MNKKNNNTKFNPLNPNKWAIVTVIRDIKNYIDWIKTLNREKQNANSLWYKFNMKNNYFYTIYFPITLPDEDKALPDSIKRLRVVESLAPVHRYLDEDLQFAEYIVPEFNQFYDEDNKPTLTYGIVYRFAFKRLSVGWVISRLFLLGITIWALVTYPIIQWLISLI
jgi:hypothetical protein